MTTEYVLVYLGDLGIRNKNVWVCGRTDMSEHNPEGLPHGRITLKQYMSLLKAQGINVDNPQEVRMYL